MNYEELLTAQQVADLLQMSAGYVYRLIRRRELPALRFGKSVRVRRADLIWYLREKVPPSLGQERLEAMQEAEDRKEEEENERS